MKKTTVTMLLAALLFSSIAFSKPVTAVRYIFSTIDNPAADMLGLNHVSALELFLFTFGVATVARYILRKEFLHDIRGLRREARTEEI